MSYALIFIFVLGVLVIVHEFGHFIVAKLCGVRVDRFSVGFGPVIFSKISGDTEYCVSALPLGGFVAMAGENPNESEGRPWEFNSKTLWQKFLIVVAGPLMNAFLAFVIFSGIFLTGEPTLTNRIGQVLEDSPAQRAGLSQGDVITAVNGEKAELWMDILKSIRSADEALIFTVERDGETRDITVSPQMKQSSALFGKTTRTPFVGIAPSSEVLHVRHGFFESLTLGFNQVAGMTGMILHSLWLLVTGVLSFKESMSGPIGIFFMAGDAAKLGVAHLFSFMASLSVSLFVLNLLPIPVLDGGHLMFIVIEKIKGSPLKEWVKERLTQAGMACLLLLMAVTLMQDIQRHSIIDHVKGYFIKK